MNFERANYVDDVLKLDFPLNRVVIAQASDKQLVYYWFVQRGRRIANEYWSKWYLFADAVTKNRTDGALVRLTTRLYPGESEREADQRLQSLIRELEPRLSAYLPPEADVKSYPSELIGSALPVVTPAKADTSPQGRQ